MQTLFQKSCYHAAVSSLVGLIVLGIAWELWLAPLRPGGSWMVLKVIPLLLPLRGVIKRDIYTLQWSSMLILIYFTEGIVRATSDRVPLSATLGWIEVALVCIYFFSVIYYLKPYKKAAKKITREVIAKATEKAAK
ncbi:DUF2069 domain-containing protein [Actimicrobium sp. CCC2.4]|uniref:DUF2069 domain-containing protein n=1 Tax=Actimicrobium sp. CCC2.4 TaxID=3048606 RepID=UPI002AC98B62|nr:DUF2069 domain-containing protein [Actimicrobium sp. CCC2.4]MEB0133951.1 DUF2069 domain-containing protein [Actimicrobium sp. CCC2.4]WPX31490.1 DUF2069 domain-containing protein [Actimicrobium sp. CCC2.4]